MVVFVVDLAGRLATSVYAAGSVGVVGQLAVESTIGNSAGIALPELVIGVPPMLLWTLLLLRMDLLLVLEDLVTGELRPPFWEADAHE